MQETMESMVGARFFSTKDLKSGFWQVKMAKDSQQYTAFTVGSMGVYEFLRMPYRLCNAPATFQRLMQNCLGELNLTYALIYLDNVIVFSQTEEEHLHHLRVVFVRFLEHRLKLKLSKCHFLQDEITFLGHEILAKGMKPGTANLKAIAEMALPRTYTEIRRFTGMTGFFRRFIKGYSKIAKPLNDLLEGEASKLKAEEVELPPDALKAFEELKLRCMTAPVLVFTDFKKPFRLETDASKEGLGAVLLQESDDGQYHPVAFGSHELKGGEPKYHSSKLEFLALKWAVTEQFREYLQYQPFTVHTDNNLLTFILTTPNLDALGHRWVAALAGYNMKLEYLKGSDNKVADTLSRISTQKLDEETVTELLNYARNGGALRAETANINVIEVATNAIPDAAPSPEFLRKLDELEPNRNPPKKLTIEERQKLLLELLQKEVRLDKLKEWPSELALKFERMLMEHHNIFSLEQNEIGCTDMAEHIIELLDTEPFKERLWRIAPPLVEEVREHIQEMLDGGMIHLSQSPWCNAVVLVRKKDGGLRFCIDFRRLNS